MGWPPPSHLSPIFKVEGVATPIHFSFLKEAGHPSHLSPILEHRMWLSPSTSFLENGWPPPPHTLLQCIIPCGQVLQCIILCYTRLYYTILSYITILLLSCPKLQCAVFLFRHGMATSSSFAPHLLVEGVSPLSTSTFCEWMSTSSPYHKSYTVECGDPHLLLLWRNGWPPPHTVFQCIIWLYAV